jgi:predicted nucleotide-binding protein
MWEGHLKALERARVAVRSEVDRLDLFGTPVSAQPRGPSGSRVFLVHGHDEELLNQAADALRALTGKEPVILRDQPNAGRTVIEKLVDEFDDVAYAIVMMTADDEGRAVRITRAAGQEPGEFLPRARQNVLLELGYAVGKLGRGRVAVLYEPGVERPSDFDGVAYLSTASGWVKDLNRELRAAGVDSSMDRL